MVEQGQAVGAGHHDVGENEVVVGVLLEPCYGLFRAFGEGGGVAAAFEQRCYDAAYGLFIVDYQDSFLRHGQTLSCEWRCRLFRDWRAGSPSLSAANPIRLVRYLKVIFG